ncbi:hypothetical protein [Saccharolobus islandicus]|uniref:Uncharacterized protein n=2 Tax=Saccharolobus islandicus TaxID=43080 RepID=F0ND95_SACI5|nr:hypothetical protein [Sulfolobus islandicus]ADX83731.1 hypothetical protein SiH_2392 [Sulfolobus islandicus HVE10/4]ADX86392.1 hypothetical protein SiRe_2342 [Sulfolobus islandicus REY15A]WCM37547.1 hypothetical protein GO599_08785 [Sulfolobus islandicus]
MLDKVRETVRKFDPNAEIQISRNKKFTKIRVKSNRYCDRAKIWISLHELFKDHENIIIEVE